jgi:histidinol-phosphatase
MSDNQLAPRLEWALAAAREAGQLTLRYFRAADLAVETKLDASPVTVADRQAEQLLRARITERFADDAILGEEFPEKQGTSGFRWILDPIDGTKSFITGVPLYGTLVGIEHQGRSVVGVIDIPALDERVYAAVGGGAWYQHGNAAPSRAAVSSKATLAESVFCTSDCRFPTPARIKAFRRLSYACRIARTWGDCYGYLLVATGRAEIMVDPLMNVWDAAAIQPIVTEAGGTFTDWRGEPTIYHGEGIATNGHVLKEVLAITSGT